MQSNTVEDTDELPAKNEACLAAGKQAIEVLPYDTQEEATNAVVLGKADALSADSPVTLYAISKTDGKLEPAGESFRRCALRHGREQGLRTDQGRAGCAAVHG